MVEPQPVHFAPVCGLPHPLHCLRHLPVDVDGFAAVHRLSAVVEDQEDVAGGAAQVHHSFELDFAAGSLLLSPDMASSEGRCGESGRCAEEGSAQGADETVDRF
ncbi:hypothetical protein ACFUJR_29665 [Streptomyces sp. NPDC057271]|uniref:hypothetical protein n=1 Tax=unclassified Streptomyces TaxID=2593676 RepID=UPI00362687A2